VHWTFKKDSIIWPVTSRHCLTWEVPGGVERQFQTCLSLVKETLDFEAVTALRITRDAVKYCHCYLAETEDWNSLQPKWEEFWLETEPDTTVIPARFDDENLKFEMELFLEGDFKSLSASQNSH